MGPSHASEAIILRTRAYGESDKIVTFLAHDAGKLTGIAKGAKNSRRRFANCLDTFTRVRAHYRTRIGATLVFLESCDLLRPPGVLAEPAKFAYGHYLIELVDQLTEEAHPVSDVYRLLDEGLAELQTGTATAAFLRVFELRLLQCAGYDPQLKACTRCNRSLDTASAAYLDPTQGTIVCAGCGSAAQSLLPIGAETLLLLESMKILPLAAARLRRLSAATAAEAAHLMGHLLAQHLPRPLRSVKLIAALST